MCSMYILDILSHLTANLLARQKDWSYRERLETINLPSKEKSKGRLHHDLRVSKLLREQFFERCIVQLEVIGRN